MQVTYHIDTHMTIKGRWGRLRRIVLLILSLEAGTRRARYRKWVGPCATRVGPCGEGPGAAAHCAAGKIRSSVIVAAGAGAVLPPSNLARGASRWTGRKQRRCLRRHLFTKCGKAFGIRFGGEATVLRGMMCLKRRWQMRELVNRCLLLLQ